MARDTTATQLIQAARTLCGEVEKLRFGPPVSHVYNPLNYAWEAHKEYLSRFGAGRKDVVFLGMNPGPFGMLQTGVPFGEIGAVRDWMRIHSPVAKPRHEHPRRPIEGMDCSRTEISGKRLWGLFAARYGSAEAFFEKNFVVNYCPLGFLQTSGANFTPDKLPAAETEALYRVCDAHLRSVLKILEPRWVIGIGAFAALRVELLAQPPVRTGRILHPSPASPAANRDWSGRATEQLRMLGVWE